MNPDHLQPVESTSPAPLSEPLATPPLPLMQMLAMQVLYQMAFEEAASDAREAMRRRRYEPGLN